MYIHKTSASWLVCRTYLRIHHSFCHSASQWQHHAASTVSIEQDNFELWISWIKVCSEIIMNWCTPKLKVPSYSPLRTNHSIPSLVWLQIAQILRLRIGGVHNKSKLEWKRGPLEGVNTKRQNAYSALLGSWNLLVQGFAKVDLDPP